MTATSDVRVGGADVIHGDGAADVDDPHEVAGVGGVPGLAKLPAGATTLALKTIQSYPGDKAALNLRTGTDAQAPPAASGAQPPAIIAAPVTTTAARR